MIYTTYFARLRGMPSAVVPVAISNTLPNGVDMLHAPELAPPWEAVTDYKHTGDRNLFRESYYRALSLVDRSVFDALISSGPIALVCYEKDPQQCHRSLLGEWLKEHYNVEVAEWGCC